MIIQIRADVFMLVGFFAFAVGAFAQYMSGRSDYLQEQEKKDAITGYWATRRSAENRALHQLLIRYNVPADTINDCIGDFEWKADSVLHSYSEKTHWRNLAK